MSPLMKMGCFGCDEVLEAPDADALADAFVAHAGAGHDWSYPEEAIRMYARNVGEAGERLSDATERLPQIGEVAVHPVTEDRIDDWLQFFDHDAFAGNPEWASCYCLEPHRPEDENEERPWRDNRATMTERLRDGGTFGYLAYVDGSPAGWVNASMRSEYGLYRMIDPGGPDPSEVIGVSCFIIAPPYRKHGVASALLDQVIADGDARDAAWIEGYPRNDPDDPRDGAYFRGPRSMYDARGFHPIEVRERDTVMRRAVGEG